MATVKTMKLKGIRQMNWRPTAQDQIIMDKLLRKLGIAGSDILRIAIRRLAEAEGIKAA